MFCTLRAEPVLPLSPFLGLPPSPSRLLFDVHFFSFSKLVRYANIGMWWGKMNLAGPWIPLGGLTQSPPTRGSRLDPSSSGAPHTFGKTQCQPHRVQGTLEPSGLHHLPIVQPEVNFWNSISSSVNLRESVSGWHGTRITSAVFHKLPGSWKSHWSLYRFPGLSSESADLVKLDWDLGRADWFSFCLSFLPFLLFSSFSLASWADHKLYYNT